MRNTSSLRKLRDRASGSTRVRAAAGWLAVLSLVAFGASADDRDLLSATGSEDPFVFIIFDTSGSMAATAACSQSDTFNDIDPFDSMCTQECTLEDATCARICPSLGCREYASDVVVELEEIIIDNDDPAVSYDPINPPAAGGWRGPFMDPAPFKGSDFYCDDNNGEDGIGNHWTATFDPSIVNSGTYMIYGSWPGGSSEATNVMVDVTHFDGANTVTDTVFVDHSTSVEWGASTEFDGWNLIGTFYLDAPADNGTVVVRNEAADFYVTVDAFRWVRIDVPPCLDPSDLIYRCQQRICTDGDCWTPLNGDDPNSKMYQAKQALYEVIDSVEDVHFGFGSYEQDNARLHAKHWLYRVREESPLNPGTPQPLPTLGGTPLLEAGDDQVFGNWSTMYTTPQLLDGDGYNCYTRFTLDDPPVSYDDSRNDQRVGCNPNWPVDITDQWEAQRGHRIPKLGYDGSLWTRIWYRTDYTDIYRVGYTDNGDSFGSDTFSANIAVESCPGGTGASCVVQSSWTVYYDLVSDYAAVEAPTLRHPQSSGGFFYLQANMQALDGIQNYTRDRSTCFGLEPNDDSDFDDDGDFEADDVDTRDDLWYDYSIKWPTIQDARGDDLDLDGTPDSPRRDVFDVGDRIPLDWLTKNRDEIKRRLAPNMVRGTDPEDFRIATYFENDVGPYILSNVGTHDDDGDHRRLRLVDDETDGDTSDDERPLVAKGQTPLGESLADFKVWYSGPADIAPGDDPDDAKYQGWADVAAVFDSSFPCRQKYLLMLTDGIDTCLGECQDPTQSASSCTGPTFDNDPCDVSADLFNGEGVATYVVGFGVSAGSSLDCIAQGGGTVEPILPRNKEELVEALNSILTDVQAERRTFASASIPAVQSTAADKIFLSSFTPIPEPTVGIWPGRIDAFRAPLPLRGDNTPNVDRACGSVDAASGTLQSACHLWEAGEVLCGQVASGTRKVLYGMEHTAGTIPGASRPGTLREFKVPTFLSANPTGGYADGHPDLPLVEDLVEPFIPGLWDLYVAGSVNNGDMDTALSAIVNTITGYKDLPADLIGQIDACDTNSDDESDAYVLGDIFHASPIAISGPSDFTLFANDQCGTALRTDIPSNCVSPVDLDVEEDRGYRRFAADHVWRRRMLAAPTNDGQLHIFDTGVRQLVDNDFTTAANDKIELFNDGSGQELFSYIPRMVLPILRDQIAGDDHIFSMDGTVSLGDVFIDVGDVIGSTAAELDRAWRTVLVGGLREAGDILGDADRVEGFKSGYYALDVTQPDAVGVRSVEEDLTLFTCETAGCLETDVPAAEYSPSCLVFDGQGIVDSTTDCPFRIDPAPTDTPQFPAELWTFKDSWLIEDPANAGEYLEFYLDEDDGGDPADSADDENGYGVPDLADTWSRPVITQVAVCPAGATNCVFGEVDPLDVDPGPDGSDLITKHVAIFGGGMDPENKDASDPRNLRGAYLYMVDIETGFPIYKRRLCPDAANDVCGTGAAPSDPAAVDLDRDGIADVVYIGTTDGYLYKVKLSTDVGDTVPNLQAIDIEAGQLIRDSSGDNETFATWADVSPALDPVLDLGTSAMSTLCGTADPCAPRIVDAAWDPFPILDAGGTAIHYAASAFLIPERDQLGLAIGTGDREDLWSLPSEGGTESKFFIIVDENFTQSDLNDVGPCIADGIDPGLLPITEDCLVSFSFTAEPFDSEINLLTEVVDNSWVLPTGVDPVFEPMRPGWAMSFPTSDPLQNRVTTEAFVVSGIVVFSVFDPNLVLSLGGDDDDDDDVVAVGDDDDDDDDQCGFTGTTRAFVVRAINGGPVVNLSSLGDTGEGSLSDDDDDSSGDDDDPDEDDRYLEIDEFTTAPQVVKRQTSNKPGDGDKSIDELISKELRDSFREALLAHLPRGSRFNEAFEMVIVALRNSTGVNVFASIPIAIYPADWRDQ